MSDSKSCEDVSSTLMHSQPIKDSEETQVPYNSDEPDISQLSESVIASTHNESNSKLELNDTNGDTLQSHKENANSNENDSKLSKRTTTSESRNESRDTHPPVEEDKIDNSNMIDDVKSSAKTEIPSSSINNSVRTTINLDDKLSNLNIHDQTIQALNLKDDVLTKNQSTTEPQDVDIKEPERQNLEIPLVSSKETIIAPLQKNGSTNADSKPADKDIIGISNANINVGINDKIFLENSATPHASTTTLTQQTQVPPNSLHIQNMTSVLSQSTGQEERFSDMKLPANDSQIYAGQSGLPHEPKVQLSRNNHFKDLDTTANFSTSGVSTVTNQDSLIFQQSGLTLYNLNSHSTNNLNHSNGHPMNQYTISRNISQQSLRRQESYLTFKAPDNLRKNVKSSSGDTSFKNGNQTPEIIPIHEFRVSSKKEQQEPNHNRTATQTNSLLSQQKKNQEEEDKLQNVIDIDLSSYLSAQEPEIDSRTQQKLWLQRENVANLNDFEDTQHAPAAIINQSTRFQYEQHSREFLHIRRFMNPMLDSLNRIKNSGVSKRRLSIENSNTEASSLLAKSVRDASTKAKFQSTSLAKSMGLVKDNKGSNVVFESDLSDYKDILKAMWNKDCDEFKGGNSDSSHTTNPSSTSTNITQQYQSTQGRPFTNGASPHYNYPASTAFARGNNTSFGHVNPHSLNTPSIRR